MTPDWGTLELTQNHCPHVPPPPSPPGPCRVTAPAGDLRGQALPLPNEGHFLSLHRVPPPPPSAGQGGCALCVLTLHEVKSGCRQQGGVFAAGHTHSLQQGPQWGQGWGGGWGLTGHGGLENVSQHKDSPRSTSTMMQDPLC